MSWFAERQLMRWIMLIAVAGVLPVLAARARAEEPVKVQSPPLQFSEKQVAGGPDDFMIVRHVRMAGTNREIGKKLAEIAKTRHGSKPEPADAAALRARRDFYLRNYPNHFERAAGAAEAFGMTLETANADVMEMSFNINLAPACSTVYYPPPYTDAGHGILSRNYDFSTGTAADIFRLPSAPGARAMTGDVYVIEIYPDKGYPSLYICAYDLLGGCIDGVNSEGLTVALLADNEIGKTMDPARGAQAGLNEIEVTRYLLDTCANVGQAKSALMAAKQYYSFVPCHYIIGDRAGKSFAWEYSPAHNREYITDGGGQPQVITNHPLYKYNAAEQMPRPDAPLNTYYRYRRLRKEIDKVEGKHTIDNIKQTNRCVSVTLPPDPGFKPSRTLWHAIYDCTDLTLQVDFYLGEGTTPDAEPRRSGYLSFRLAKQ